jgi:hypothetical protein
MKNQLAPTGLYRLDGTTAVDFELASYAAGFEPIRRDLLALQTESYAATACGYGLRSKERVFALTPRGDTESQREALLRLCAVRRGSCTKEGIESALSALGLSVRLEEDPANLKIIAHFLSPPACGETAAKKKLEIFCPAHLLVELDFSGIS